MSLLRWMGVAQTSSSPNPNTTNGPSSTGPSPNPKQAINNPESTVVPLSTADAKRFGLENFGNTCYANSVLQALYFCEPFRELVTLTPDRSSLYPTPPPLVIPQVPTSSHPPSSTISPSTSKSYSAKTGTNKPGTTSSTGTKPAPKRPLSSSFPAEQDEGKVVNATGTAGGAGSTPNIGPALGANPPNLFEALRSLFVHISGHSSDKGTVAPQAFIAKLKRDNELFRSTMHQDAHEFLNYLINRVVEDLEEEERLSRVAAKEQRISAADKGKEPAAAVKEKEEDGERIGNGHANGVPIAEDLSASIATLSSKPAVSVTGRKNVTFVHELFEGTLTSETRCLTCETVSSRDEPFLDLSIDIHPNTSITACLRQFSASEMLCQRNKFFCDSCCGLQEAEKRMKIKRLPGVLVVHLKRFKYQEEEGKYVKLSYRVAFPFELRLFNTVDDPGADGKDLDRLYELWAVVVHIGGGPLHGHYITLIKAQGTWYVFDDNTVETIKESDIPRYYGDSGSGTGYVLFYQAVNLDREGLGLRPTAVPTSNIMTNAVTVNGEALVQQVPIEAHAHATSTGDIPAELEPAGPPSPAVPISVEPSSPTSPHPNPSETLPSLPPSPLASTTHPIPTKLEIPSSGHSPSNGNLPLPSPPPIIASLPSSNGGGFFSSLRHSRSLKAKDGHHRDRALVNGDVPVPSIPVDKDAHKEEKEKAGWLGFGRKEKRRDSVSQTSTVQTQSLAGSQNQSLLHLHTSASTTPSSPLPTTTFTTAVPPSPRTSNAGKRPSTGTSFGGAMDQLAPLPGAAIITISSSQSPVPPSPLLATTLSTTVQSTSPASQHATTTRRASTTDQPIDGSDSFSGSSSWTSGVLNVPTLDIPPVPKDLPPVPPLPPPIPIPTPNQELALSDTPVLSVGSGGQGTITQSPVPSIWSIPTTSGGDIRADGERLPVPMTATISSSSSNGISDLSIVTQSQHPLHIPSTSFHPSPSSTSQQSPPSATTSSSHPLRMTKLSIKDIKEASKARKAAERAEEERRRVERVERERQEKAEREKEKEHHRLAKRASRKLSFGFWGGHKEKDREKDKATNSFTGSSTSGKGVMAGNIS